MIKSFITVSLFACSTAFAGSWGGAIANVDVIQVTQQNFGQIEKSTKPVVIDINATWCSACQMMNPIIDELSEEYQGKVIFAKIDIDSQHDLANKYHVSALPTIVFLKPGQATPVMKVEGAMSKEDFEAKINELLK